jgi:hypothetical protein
MSYDNTLTIKLPFALADIASRIGPKGGKVHVKTGHIGTKGHSGPVINGPSDITAELASKVFSYNQDTGVITRVIAIGGKTPGEITQVDRSGYIKTSFMGVQLRGHRLAWLLHYGEFPAVGMEIDHINHDKTDNRIKNLRSVTKSTNQHNLYKSRPQSKTGLLGVSKANQKFQAEIVAPGSKRKYLGVFDTPELAHEAYMQAKTKYYPGVMTP